MADEDVRAELERLRDSTFADSLMARDGATLADGAFAALRAVAAALVVAAAPLAGQDRVPARLTLAQAIEIATSTNPGFLQTRNDGDLADWDVRQAWGALAPSASVSGGMSWQGSGEQRFGTITLGDLVMYSQAIQRG